MIKIIHSINGRHINQIGDIKRDLQVVVIEDGKKYPIFMGGDKLLLIKHQGGIIENNIDLQRSTGLIYVKDFNRNHVSIHGHY